MHIAQLTPDDATLAQVIVRQFHGREVSQSYMRRFLSRPGNFVWVAQDDEHLAGFISAHELDSIEREATALFIYEVEVAPSYRRQGMGRALMERVHDFALARGLFEMFVFTEHSNPTAAAFYQATGGHIENGDELMFVWSLRGDV